jgi:hypothetical protein
MNPVDDEPVGEQLTYMNTQLLTQLEMSDSDIDFAEGLYKGRERRKATGVFRADVKLDSNGKFQIASYQLANSNL